MTVQEYREWIQLDGMPLCGTITKKGSFCNNPVGRIQLARQGLARQASDLLLHGAPTKAGSAREATLMPIKREDVIAPLELLEARRLMEAVSAGASAATV